MIVKVINKSHHALPAYETKLAAGLDLRAFLQEPVMLKPLQRLLIPTGIYVEIPAGFEIQIRPRSGMAYKHGITVLNTPGTIDADYRGEVKVLLVNLSDQEMLINDGERVAQTVLAKHEQIEWEATIELNETARGEGGFGHTGKN